MICYAMLSYAMGYTLPCYAMLYHIQLVNKLQQTCQFHQVATSVLKSGLFKLEFLDLLQLVEKTCSTAVDNKF